MTTTQRQRSGTADAAALPPGSGPSGPSAGSKRRAETHGGSLHELAIRSAGYLAGREVVGMGVRLVGAVITMRAIGPADYGIFSAAAAFMLFISTVAQMGIEVFLIRAPEPPTRRRYNEAFTYLLVTSTVVSLAALGLTVPFGGLLRPVGVLLPLRVLLVLIPINVLWAPAQACIERQFGYRRMGILEVGGDVVLYATAVPLALYGFGSWSLVVGYFAWQIWLLVGSLAFSGLRPRLAWSSAAAREMIRHGIGFSLSKWANSGTQVVIALVVGTFGGPVGVGYVSFALRLIGMLNFTRRGVFRIGMVAVSQARSGGLRLARALDDGSFLVLVAAAAPFAAFGLVARWVIPAVFGTSWDPALHLYVVLSVVAVLGVLNMVQCTVLYAVGDNLRVAWASLLQLVVLTAAAVVLVPAAGIVGFGLASGLSLVSTVVTHRAMARIAPMRYRRLLLPLLMLVPPMLAPLFTLPRSLLTLVPPLVALAFPATRRELRLLAEVARTMLGRTRPSPTPQAPVAVQAAGAPDALDGAGDRVGGAGLELGRAAGDALGGGADVTFAGGERGAEVTGGQPADYWLLPPDAITGAASLEVMLARAGRLLGGARCSGWPLMLAAFELSPVAPAQQVREAALRAVSHALRADLRFDDPVTRVPPATFVVATALVPGGAGGPEVAGRLAGSVTEALAGGDPAAVTMRWSYVVTAASSADEVDELLRRVVEDLRG